MSACRACLVLVNMEAGTVFFFDNCIHNTVASHYTEYYSGYSPYLMSLVRPYTLSYFALFLPLFAFINFPIPRVLTPAY